MIPTDPDELDVLAGEYVVGTLDETTRRDVEAALPVNAALALRVRAWEERLYPVAAALPPDIADPSLWRRIERSIAGAPQLEPIRSRYLAIRLWRSTPFWRAATALATAACLVLALLPARTGETPDGPPRFFAILQTRDASGQDGGPGWLIQIGRDGTVRSLPLGAVQPGQGRALQLWTLWDQAQGPVSLGVLPPGGTARIPADRLPVIGGGQLFEITLEPEAGSPTGRPTGRILFIGRASPAAAQAL